ncbi:MAG: acyltransferase [Gemmatimonadaceae bacterium]
MSERIPSLDGLRAVAILTVLLGHLSGTRGFPAAATSVFRNDVVSLSELGVRVFFVISGFLISHLLLSEVQRTGHVSLRNFYIRRTFRIVPVYLLYLCVVSFIGITTVDKWHALTYTTNYSIGRSWIVGHLWSLSVEEQFYLVWPVLIAASSIRGARCAAIAALCVVPLIRVGEAMFVPSMMPLIGSTFETTADAIAIGCVLALTRDQLYAQAWYRRVIASRWMIPGLLALGIVGSLRFRPALLLGIPLTNVAIALLIDRAVRMPNGWMGWLLNTRPLVFIGTLSYSLYLWQQPFLNRAGMGAFNAFPLNILTACVVAIASYYVIEQPVRNQRVAVTTWCRSTRDGFVSRLASVGMK